MSRKRSERAPKFSVRARNEKKSAPAARQPADAYRRMLAPAEASLCKCLAKLAGASLYAYRANAYKTGSNITYAGGGSGAEDANRTDLAGGDGGGGIGRGTPANGVGGDGTDGLGGGGGGAGENTGHKGGDGGNGVVIIRYAV